MVPISDLLRGLKTFWTGVDWLRQRPSILASLFVPWIVGFIVMLISFALFLDNQTAIMAAILFDPGNSWWMQPLYYISYGLVWLGVAILALVTGVLIVNVVAAPLYEWVSVKVEKDIRGGHVEEVSIWHSLRLIPEELKKVVFILLIPLIVTLIPGLNVFSFIVTGFMLGWDFYDYPLARRGWRFRRRWEFVRGDFWAVLGLGLWLAIPFVQFVLMPLAIVGGTMLNLQRLQKMGLLESSPQAVQSMS